MSFIIKALRDIFLHETQEAVTTGRISSDDLRSEQEFWEHYGKQLAVQLNNYILLRGIVRGDRAAMAAEDDGAGLGLRPR